MQQHHEDEEVTVEPDKTEAMDENDEADFGNEAQAKLKALRNKLKACEVDKMEHLAGWQRAKADLVNYKKEVAAGFERERTRAAETIITDLLAVVDSFGMAMKGQAWQNVDRNWRMGVEHIHAQLMNVLREHGLETFGKAGDAFDPNIHESVSTASVTDHAQDHMIHEIIQPGFMLHDKLIRPAKVVVAVYNAHTN